MSEGLNEEFMYTRHVRCNMAKLYWRIKTANGKWNWVAFSNHNSKVDYQSNSGWSYSKEEE